MKSLSDEDKHSLYNAFLSLKTEDECQKFLRDLLTKTEIDEFANRWKVARMLHQKHSYKDIEEATGMSSTTIARISKWLSDGMGGYKLMLNRISNSKAHAHHTRR